MELKSNPHRAVTLIELIVAITIFSVVLLAAFGVIVSQVQYLQIFRQESMLKEDNAYIVDRLRKIIMDSEHVDITTSPLLGLKVYDRSGLIGTVELSAAIPTTTATLTYNRLVPPSPAEIISTNVGSLSFSNAQDSSNTTTVRLLKVALSTSDPKRTGVSSASIITSIACRLTPNIYSVKNVTKFPAKYYYKIQDALSDASSGDEIRCMGNNSGIFDGVFGENITINKSITLKGSYDKTFTTQTFNSNDPTAGTPATIDGQLKGTVVNCLATAINIDIDRFIIQNGKAMVVEDNPIGGGGGIHVESPGSTVNITNNTITGNNATLDSGDSCYGGGIYANSSAGSTITISNNVIEKNSLFAMFLQGGGGVAIRSNNSAVIITQNTIRGNTIDGEEPYGGGVYASASGANVSNNFIAITNNTITGNKSIAHGNGVYAYSCDSSSVIIGNNAITDNIGLDFSHGGDGGGISAKSENSSSITISNNEIKRNINGDVRNDYGTGGGISALCYNSSSIKIINNDISDKNTAQEGCGIHADSRDNSSLSIDNNSITDNTTGSHGFSGGGGISAYCQKDSSLSIIHNTISKNIVDAAFGGGILAYLTAYPSTSGTNGSLTIANNIISGNTLSRTHIIGTAPIPRGGAGINAQCSASYDSHLTITNNIINGNKFTELKEGGGGIAAYCYYATAPLTITNNTIINNECSGGGYGSGIYGYITSPSTIDVTNVICYDNPFTFPPNYGTIYKDWTSSGTFNVDYCDLGGTGGPYAGAGAHSISQPPQFVNPTNGDYHLQTGSPCIGTGNPSGTDMGAYGGPGAGVVGFVKPTTNDSSTPYIKEDAIGTY